MKRVGTFLLHLFIAATLLLAPPKPALAGWPSAEDVIKEIAPLAGLNADQVEFTLFALKEPDCAATLVSYTMAQDYSLAIFAAALKTTKFQSLPQLPKMSAAQCTGYNPVQQAYLFVEGVGGKLLGSSQSGLYKELLQSQVAEGKSALEAQLAAIPYLGTILTNWDCACNVAFKTNFKDEKAIDATVANVISIGSAVKSGDIPGALEIMITSLGPKVACELGAQWTGVGSIPIVSDIATEACSSVAGEAVGWVVDAGSTTAEALGIIGGEHIPPDQYYKQMFQPELGKDGYMELADIIYGKCYDYFEASNMATSTAKKVCVGMRSRYVEESIGKVQWNDFQYERAGYYLKNMEPKAIEAALLGDDAFTKMKSTLEATCKTYFVQKYPKANLYVKAYGGDPIEATCTDFATDSTSSYAQYDMGKARAQAQFKITSAELQKLYPFCSKGNERNVIVCSQQSHAQCTTDLPSICKKTTSPYGGMEMPCCKLGSGEDVTFAGNTKFAGDIAKKSGAPYCSTDKKDPLNIVCVLDQTYDACRKTKTSHGGLPDCSTVEKGAANAALSICCSKDPSGLAKISGVAEAKSFVEETNKSDADACGIGGFQEGLSYDPMIVHCRSDVMPACKKAFSSSCKKSTAGFVTAPCCDLAVFASAKTPAEPYDPSKRSEEDLALAARAVEDSHGQCAFASGPGGDPDKFRVTCKSLASTKSCVQSIGRPAKTPCTAKLQDGYVTSPCCESSAEALTGDARESVDVNMQAPKAGDVGGLSGAGLGGSGTQPKSRTMGGATASGQALGGLSRSATEDKPPLLRRQPARLPGLSSPSSSAREAPSSEETTTAPTTRRVIRLPAASSNPDERTTDESTSTEEPARASPTGRTSPIGRTSAEESTPERGR